MRLLTLSLLIIATSLALSCNKHNNPAPDTSLQHKWQVVSITYGSNHVPIKQTDYWEFGKSDTLIEFSGGNYDTLHYELDSTGKVLTITPFPWAGFAITANITTLTGSHLVLSGTSVGGFVGSEASYNASFNR
jgi:hypothetical protein